MSAKIIPFTGITRLDIPPDQILDRAKGRLEGVLVIGFDNEGEFYGASSYADGGTALWLLEVCRQRLIQASE